MDAEIQARAREINRCNQRGGRMLTLLDLMAAGTMTRDMAAFSLAAIGAGASFMVGARPGGAGKTTVMGALLNLVPPDIELAAAEDERVIEDGLRGVQRRRCYVCHEIGAGPYYAYLWGRALRRYFELPAAGHLLATNLHADTYAQARGQVCGENRVPPAAFRRLNLIYFLACDGTAWNARRRIVALWESDGAEAHRPIHGEGAAEPLPRATRLVSAGRFEAALATLDALAASGAGTIEAVGAFLARRRRAVA